ncbi:RNA-directed DNA polymerase, eukaryota, reverse transcriptase zinc-binding domain protein [Tanacetum coccineum]
MFEIEDSKAPGSDRYTSRFFKSSWSIVGREMCHAVKEFFLTGKLLGEKCIRGRGLRQGDPISPYLFTLVMEVLNLLIKKNIEDNMGFQYHFGCKNLKITYLCFADDLLVFCHEDTQSVRIIKKSLDEFSEHTGLLPNMRKSTILFGGLSNAEQQNILNLMPFTMSRLPVRYLGVPLITKQISISNCKPLVDKVRSKVNDWKNKALSYAGRVQLIASILSSMQNYRASVFLLPKQVIYEINKMLKGFLWCQGELANGKAKVSWETVCKPKNQGGLGIKDLGVWNEHIRWKLGNGKSVNVWHDRWCSVSPLSDFITTRDMYDARLRNECTVREVIHEGRWKWPAEWNNDFTELDQLQVPMLKEDVEDKAREQQLIGTSLFALHSIYQDMLFKCIDSHNHMFFTCELSNEVCKELVKLINVRLSEGWDQIIMEMVALPLNKNIWSIMRRIVCSATVYYIWQERNNRLFKNEHRTKDKLLSIIKETIILKLAGLTVKESNTVKEVEDKWVIKMQRYC